jgi:hypothetical protein
MTQTFGFTPIPAAPKPDDPPTDAEIAAIVQEVAGSYDVSPYTQDGTYDYDPWYGPYEDAAPTPLCARTRRGARRNAHPQ